MFNNLFAVTSNTFTEALRQPVYGVVIAGTVLLLIFGPSLSMYTLDDDNKLLKDTALSTLLVAGLFLAVFATATVVAGEIDNKTVLTVISKSVSRSTFVVGKFLGVAGSVVLAQIFLALVLLIIDRHGVLQRASDDRDWVVVSLGSAAIGLTILVSLLGNYFYRWRFSSAAILLGTALAVIVLALLSFIDPKWQFNPAKNNIDWHLIGPIVLIIFATFILTAISVAAATRMGLVMTLIISILFFVLGVTLQPWLEPVAKQSTAIGYLAKTVLAIFPSINMYVVTNAVYQGTSIPLDYIGQTALYAALYVTAILLFAIAMFRTREIG